MQATREDVGGSLPWPGGNRALATALCKKYMLRAPVVINTYLQDAGAVPHHWGQLLEVGIRFDFGSLHP
jgi:hypothetical protein